MLTAPSPWLAATRRPPPPPWPPCRSDKAPQEAGAQPSGCRLVVTLRGETDKRGNGETRVCGDQREGDSGVPPHSDGAGSEQREEEADRWGVRV